MSTAAFVVACAVIAYSGFCRLVYVDLSTQFFIRLAVYVLTVAATAALSGVLLWGYEPGWPAVSLALAVAVLQLATARFWRDGVPHLYRRHD